MLSWLAGQQLETTGSVHVAADLLQCDGGFNLATITCMMCGCAERLSQGSRWTLYARVRAAFAKFSHSRRFTTGGHSIAGGSLSRSLFLAQFGPIAEPGKQGVHRPRPGLAIFGHTNSTVSRQHTRPRSYQRVVVRVPCCFDRCPLVNPLQGLDRSELSAVTVRPFLAALCRCQRNIAGQTIAISNSGVLKGQGWRLSG